MGHKLNPKPPNKSRFATRLRPISRSINSRIAVTRWLIIGKFVSYDLERIKTVLSRRYPGKSGIQGSEYRPTSDLSMVMIARAYLNAAETALQQAEGDRRISEDRFQKVFRSSPVSLPSQPTKKQLERGGPIRLSTTMCLSDGYPKTSGFADASRSNDGNSSRHLLGTGDVRPQLLDQRL
jgi:hypothetical protein